MRKLYIVSIALFMIIGLLAVFLYLFTSTAPLPASTDERVCRQTSDAICQSSNSSIGLVKAPESCLVDGEVKEGLADEIDSLNSNGTYNCS